MRYLNTHEVFEHTWDIWTHMRHLNIHEIFEHTWDIWAQSVKTWTIRFTFQHSALQLKILLANQWSILTKVFAQEANCHPVRIIREQCAFKWRVHYELDRNNRLFTDKPNHKTSSHYLLFSSHCIWCVNMLSSFVYIQT